MKSPISSNMITTEKVYIYGARYLITYSHRLLTLKLLILFNIDDRRKSPMTIPNKIQTHPIPISSVNGSPTK
jgi:hypothetical protein